MSRRSSTNEERFLTLVQDFPKMAPLPIYLSIYLSTRVVRSVPGSLVRNDSSPSGMDLRTRLEGGKGKKERSLPYGEKVSPGSINAGENLENVSELSEGKLARLFPLIARRDSRRG